MIDFSKISHVWFVGIGGIGMSALARYFAVGGFSVGGYDRTESSITGALVSEGIMVIYSDDPHEIPGEFLKRENTLVIYTPAIPPVIKYQLISGQKVSGYINDLKFSALYPVKAVL